MDKIKHIFFDLDHTLWDFDKNSELAFKQIFKEQHIDVNFNEFMNVYLPINVDYWKLFREGKVSKEELRFGRLKDAFNKIKYDTSDAFINKIANNYLEYLPNYNYLIEGAVELLEYLKQNYSLHIITNGFEKVQHQKLSNSGVKKYFDIIVTSESVGVKKPDPKIFEFALKQAKAKAEESIMIGDSYEADITGAFNSGIVPIHFNINKNNGSKGIISVNSLVDLKQYL